MQGLRHNSWEKNLDLNFWNASEFCIEVLRNCNKKYNLQFKKKNKNTLIDGGCKILLLESPKQKYYQDW